MAEKMYRLLVLRYFADGNAYERALNKGEEIIVTERQMKILMQSDPEGFERKGIVVPRATQSVVDKLTGKK